MKDRIVAPCGISCTNCPAYLATQSDDMERLQEIAERWSNEKQIYEVVDIICDGCFSDRLHTYCAECEVRACAIDNGYSVCSLCPLYPCDRLNDVWNFITQVSIEELKVNLEEEKRFIQGQSFL